MLLTNSSFFLLTYLDDKKKLKKNFEIVIFLGTYNNKNAMIKKNFIQSVQ